MYSSEFNIREIRKDQYVHQICVLCSIILRCQILCSRFRCRNGIGMTLLQFRLGELIWRPFLTSPSSVENTSILYVCTIWPRNWKIQEAVSIIAIMTYLRTIPTAALRIYPRLNSCLKNKLIFDNKLLKRELSTNPKAKPKAAGGNQNLVVASYCGAVAIFILGVAYASVPLYKVFCSMTG